MRRVIIVNKLAPGDVAVMTATIESLHRAYPGEFLTDVDTTAMDIWQHNPWIVPGLSDAEVIEAEYPLIHRSNQLPVPFLEGYSRDLSGKLGVMIPMLVRRPVFYLSDDEQKWMSQVEEKIGKRVPFWLINAGIKNDYTAKSWPVEHYQRVVDSTRDIVWVQIGEAYHPRLRGVLDMCGKTDIRQLMRLVWHSRGGVGPCTFLMHLCAGFEKPYVCLSGGREPVNWVTYAKQHTLHSIGALDCCRERACWRSRVLPDRNGDDSVCEMPTPGEWRWSPKCMSMIEPAEVVSIVRRLQK